MRLLWLSHFVPFPPRGGNVQRSHHLLREASRRHEVHLLALNQRAVLTTEDEKHEAERALRSIVASISVLDIPADASRLRWYATAVSAYFRRVPYEVAWLEQPALARQVAAALAGRAIDLVHADTLGLWPYVASWPGCRVLNHHNVESQLMSRRAGEESRPLHREYFRRDAGKLARMEGDVAPAASMNLVVSDLDADRLAATAPGARTRVVDNGVDTGYFAPAGAPARARHLVFAGTWSWFPNAAALRFLLHEIWPRLVAVDPEYSLSVVGRDPPAALLAARSDRRVEITGTVPDVRPYLDEAEVYVCPIQDGGGTRLKILDALAMAKPVVATRLAVEGLDLIEGEHYLAAETGEEFVARIRQLSADADLRSRLAAAGRALAERRYAWPVIGQKLEQAYEEARQSFLARTPAAPEQVCTSSS